jgi:hypothetical protein
VDIDAAEGDQPNFGEKFPVLYHHDARGGRFIPRAAENFAAPE